MDVRRRAGWLPEDQDDMESWLDGHRERVEARGEQVVLHPVLTEFQELIDTDPVVRMYINQMIAQVPGTKPYRKRHLESVTHMMRLINEVLTMAPEFGGHMVATPLGAILDWTMGTPAGFAAFRDPRVNAMIKKILNAWCEFLSSGDSLYVTRVGEQVRILNAHWARRWLVCCRTGLVRAGLALCACRPALVGRAVRRRA
jgi:phosphatidylserine decarboxylase